MPFINPVPKHMRWNLTDVIKNDVKIFINDFMRSLAGPRELIEKTKLPQAAKLPWPNIGPTS